MKPEFTQKPYETIEVTDDSRDAERIPVNVVAGEIGGSAVRGAEGGRWDSLESDTSETADFPNPNTRDSNEVIQKKQASAVQDGMRKDQLPTSDAVASPNLSPREAEVVNPDGTIDF